jgi:hypothetical protein
MACAVQCAKDADCKDVGADATCVQSICRRPAVTTQHDSGAPLTCDQLTTEAQNALQPLRDGADKSCQSAADCTEFTGVSCTNHCGTTKLSNKGLAAIQSQLDQIDRTVCNQFDAQGCKVIEPPCFPQGAPACVGGQCQSQPPGALAQPDSGTCGPQGDQIHNTLLNALDALDKSCNVDADCTRVQPELSCEYGCPVDASTPGAAAFASMRAGYEQSLCASYNARGCTPVITGCPATPSDPPLCIQGTCTDFVDTDAGQTCDNRTAQITADVQAVVVGADRKCSADADCQIVLPSTTCYSTCTYESLSSAGAQSLQKGLDSIDNSECPGFRQASCKTDARKCLGHPASKCSAGVCSTQ